MKRPGEPNGPEQLAITSCVDTMPLRGIMNKWTGPIAPAPSSFLGADGRSSRKNSFSPPPHAYAHQAYCRCGLYFEGRFRCCHMPPWLFCLWLRAGRTNYRHGRITCYFYLHLSFRTLSESFKTQHILGKRFEVKREREMWFSI